MCQIEVLRQCRRITILRDALGKLPEDLDETYDRILASISKQDRRDAIIALRLLAVSQCALSVADVAEAVVIDPGSCCFDVEDRLPDPFDIVDVLSSLVSCSSRQILIEGSDSLSGRYAGAELATEIRLAHYSVKEYLVSDRIRRGSRSWFYINPYEAHHSIARMCLTYLLQFDQPHFSSRETVRYYPFCLYAAEYWYKHAKSAYDLSDGRNSMNENEDLTHLVVQLLDDKTSSFINWLRLCDPCEPLDGADDTRVIECMASPMFYACYLGLKDVARLLQDQGVSINAYSTRSAGSDNTPLNGAILGGHPHMVKYLLDCDVDVNAPSHWGRTSLHQAVLQGDKSIVELLVKHGASPESKTGSTLPYDPVEPPTEDILQAIASRNNVRSSLRSQISYGLKRYILSCRSHFESSRHALKPVRHWSFYSHGSVLKTLMYGGDEHERISATGWTPLHEASWAGHTDLVRFLLQQGAEIEPKTRYGWTPLLCAAWEGHTTAARELLRQGANVDVANVYGWTPLHAASTVSMAQLLLDNGANIEAKTNYGWTPLFGAYSGDSDDMLGFFIQKGADIDAYNIYGGTALHKAARTGTEIAVRRLLQHGANRCIRSVYGTLAMEEAALHGHDHIVALFRSIPDRLLKTGERYYEVKNRPLALLDALPSVNYSGQLNDALTLVLNYCLLNRSYYD